MSLRRRLAQAFSLVAAAAVLLPWQNVDEPAKTVAGNSVSEGRIVLGVCLATIGLVQVGWRPAWIGAGFAFAITARAILRLYSDDAIEPAIGLWVSAAAALATVGLLAWNMFAGVSATPDSPDKDKPERRGLSGPLGRRQR